MYHLDNGSGVSTFSLAPVKSENRQWFTEGGHGNVISYPGADWFNMVQAELLNILDDAGIKPNKGTLNQISLAIRALSDKTAQEFKNQLGEADGYKYIGRCKSIAELRTIVPTQHGQRILVDAHYAGGVTGGGEFIADLHDTSSFDDGSNVIFLSNESCWKRKITPPSSSIYSNTEAVFFHQYTLKKSVLEELPGKNNVNQSLAFDSHQRYIYSHHVNGSPEQSYIVRYPLDYQVTEVEADAFITAGNNIGHQGLAVEYLGNISKLWASCGVGLDENYGHYAVRFEYEAADYEKFKLFDEEFSARGSCTPTISSDGRYLIARGYKDGYSIIRVWEVKNLHSAGDYSKSYLYQFGVEPISKEQEYPIQGIASDGASIYLLLGYTSINHNKLLLTYSMAGYLLAKEYLDVGKEQALQTGNGEYWEPEGITVYKNKLYMTIVSGNRGGRVNRVYSRGTSDNALQLKPEGNNPAIFINAENDIAVGEKHYFSVTQKDDNGNFNPLFQVRKNGADFLTSLNVSSPNYPRFQLTNDSGSIRVENRPVDASSHFGSIVYSNKNNEELYRLTFPKHKGQLITSASFNQKLSQNGWVKLPNGLLLQWGYYTKETGASTHEYPIVFNEVFWVDVADEVSDGSNRIFSIIVTGKDNTSFTVFSDGNVGKFKMLAIGR